jgi:Rieske Fe-S protein
MTSVLVGKLNTFVVNGPPVDITNIVRRTNPTAPGRMLTRFPDSPTGAPNLSSVSSICTHRGCNLPDGSYDAPTMVITCWCHQSEFNVVSGAVLAPPAKAPLARFAVQVDGTDVLVDVDPLPGTVA